MSSIPFFTPPVSTASVQPSEFQGPPSASPGASSLCLQLAGVASHLIHVVTGELALTQEF